MTVNKIIAILAIIVLGCALFGAFFFGRATVKTSASTITERDTVVVHDTIREYYPRVFSEAVVGKTLVKIPTPTLRGRDLTKFDLTMIDSVDIELPTTERTYKNDEYYAVVRGYDPSLKYIEVYPRTVYLTTTNTVTKHKRWNISFGAQVGYGITPQGWQPYAGLGVTFGINF